MCPTYSWLVPNVVVPLDERATGRRQWSEVARLRALRWRPAEELDPPATAASARP